MKKNYFSIIFLILLTGSVHAKIVNDSDYERYIYNIYLKHYKDPVSHSEWDSKIQSLPKKYKLKFRDNFWDLSGSFFQNSLYWSKMWVANPHVENPHLIYRGNFIKFDPQTLANVNTSEHSVDIQSQFPGLVVPKSEHTKKALSESEIPSSLPKLLSFWTVDDMIDLSQLQPVKIQRQTIIPFYLADDGPPIDGKIISKDGYGQSIGLGGENLIVRINSSDISIGSIFTVFENKGKVGSLFQFLVGLNESEIMIKGRIKVLSYLQGTDALYVATVIEALNKIVPGDPLFKGEPQFYNLSQKGTIGTGSGLIIGTPNKNQIMLSVGSIAYLDKGAAEGIHKGDIFYIRGNLEKPNLFKRPYQYDQPLLGKLRIIYSEGNVATGIIVESRNQIYVGDAFSENPGRVEDLSQSQYHEKVEDDETLNQGKELLIDFEETTGDEGGKLEPKEKPEQLKEPKTSADMDPDEYEVLDDMVPEGMEPDDGGSDDMDPDDGESDDMDPDEEGLDDMDPDEEGLDDMDPDEEGLDDMDPDEEGLDDMDPDEEGLDDMDPDEEGLDDMDPDEEGLDDTAPGNGGSDDMDPDEYEVLDDMVPEGMELDDGGSDDEGLSGELEEFEKLDAL